MDVEDSNVEIFRQTRRLSIADSLKKDIYKQADAYFMNIVYPGDHIISTQMTLNVSRNQNYRMIKIKTSDKVILLFAAIETLISRQ
ncbi:MAG: hypothetical protein LBE09_06995 [Christensenellaceae bacterium]|jgi:hypothetical protein|nr:hypothetical protein [Christensenellaceae bacterium]